MNNLFPFSLIPVLLFSLLLPCFTMEQQAYRTPKDKTDSVLLRTITNSLQEADAA